MYKWSVLVASLVLPFFAKGQTVSHADLQLIVTNDGEHFQYSISRPQQVQKAWIEVLDRPVVIDKRPVDVQRGGEFDWQWNWEAINEAQDDDRLELGLWDPDAHTIVCEGTTMRAEPGGVVAKTTAGGRTSFDPQPQLDEMELRVPEGSSDFTFEARGRDFMRDTKFHVFSQNPGACRDSLVDTEIDNLAHARVRLSAECLEAPGILFLSTDRQAKFYDNNLVWIHVASRTSPALSSIDSAVVSEEERVGNVSLILRGSNFGKESEVITGYMPTGGVHAEQVLFDTKYVSATELRATVSVNEDDRIGESIGFLHNAVVDSYALRVWVRGDQAKYELSNSIDVPVHGDPKKRRNMPVVTSISPFPIRLMTQQSPADLRVTVHGENFIPENKVTAQYGYLNETLRTEFVSPSVLHAWIPREHWRRHHVVYRLVVLTDGGLRYSRETEAKESQ
jgi:hypothetical protein